MLTVISKAPLNINDEEAMWECLCDCGGSKTIGSHYLRTQAYSCGCQKNNLAHKRKYEPLESAARGIFRKYADGGLSFEQFYELCQQNCYYCGLKPSTKSNTYRGRKTISQDMIDGYTLIYNGLDRIDSNRGHTIDNVVPCCKQCNTAKLDYSVNDFSNWLERAYNHYVVGKLKR